MIVAIVFLCCLAGFATIGVLSMRQRQTTTEDYLVAGRSVPPWLAALSSAATNNSGFMFIGLLGFTYRFGVQAVWLQTGWIVGDLIAWLWVHRRVRARSGELEVSSLPRLLGSDESGQVVRSIVVAAGVLTFVFLGGYAAAQLKAGSAALTTLFGWDPAIGILLGAVVVVVYCFAGGLRASIWTDAAQAFVMLGSLAALLGLAVAEVGSPAALFEALAAIDPALVRWLPGDLALGFLLYALGFVFGGLGVIGQPHILVRTMALRSPDDVRPAGRVYFLWFVPFSAAAVATGLYGRVLLPDLLAGVDPAAAAVAAEQTLPALATQLLPDVLLGVLLAGLFAATLSTADSQLLACSAAITQDLAPRLEGSYRATKGATLAVATLALAIALYAEEAVFSLVLTAWSALAASLGPLLLVRLARLPLPAGRALVMMGAGLVTVFAWGRSPLSADVFELLPGMVLPLALYTGAELVDRVVRRPAQSSSAGERGRAHRPERVTVPAAAGDPAVDA